MPTVFERIIERLTSTGISHQVSHHAPVFTSEEAAAVRGVSLSCGAKALIMRAGDEFLMGVIPADRKLDSKKLKQFRGVKSLRFASREEVLELTGLLPGSIPPFGSLFGLPTLMDPALGLNETITFNAGDHAISVFMSFGDYLTVEKPVVAELT
ncbi:YbaK/EbsC family protein [Zavarzinella formosa]|uniref:YbaK/EbsC family protein n=1 Tax=Zavarzinella formosa TaxID=360055 RepID=UPI0003182D7F|nr:YbaK/EbsC family protein [Zavarzinella formosa]